MASRTEVSSKRLATSYVTGIILHIIILSQILEFVTAKAVGTSLHMS